jgi:CheY-like chemotaxis protein
VSRRDLSISFSQKSQIKDSPVKLPASLNILIVDDSALNRKMMIYRLNKLKCTITQADDGDEALRTVESSM